MKSSRVIELKARAGQRCANCSKEFRVGERIKFVAYETDKARFLCHNDTSCRRHQPLTDFRQRDGQFNY